MQNQQWFKLIGKTVRMIVDDTAGGVVLFTREGLLEEACSVDERLKGCPAAVKDHFTLRLKSVGLKSGPYIEGCGEIIVIFNPKRCANLEEARQKVKKSPEVKIRLAELAAAKRKVA